MPLFHDNGDVTLTAEEYEDLADDSLMLGCLQGAGVDNWSGYDYAIDDYRELKGE